jgi:ATP-dependent DNA helicase RecG
MISVIKIDELEADRIISAPESHFFDVKSIDVLPVKLTQTICAFANADGGEVYVGIENEPRVWAGFANVEAANGHIQAFEALFPLGHGFFYNFLECQNKRGFVLKVEILKSSNVVSASNRKVYLRRSAQNLPQEDEYSLERLRRNKGISSFETELLNTDPVFIFDSDVSNKFMKAILQSADTEKWMRKQQLVRDNKPTVAGAILFSDEPQALLPKRSGIKIYRYETREEGERSRLAYDPITIEGCAYEIIKDALSETVRQIEGIQIMTESGLKKTRYPKEALHEIITNSVLHRDYSVPDDVHIRIFDNRVEVQSPGLLPAHITPDNILEERFSRNGVLVRLINKFPDAPNKDVGEGLNTAFDEMKKMRLVEPTIHQSGLNVIVTLRHETLGTPESIIMKYLEKNDSIVNRKARILTNIGSENSMKHTLRKMVAAGMLEVVSGKIVFDTKYVKAKQNK